MVAQTGVSVASGCYHCKASLNHPSIKRVLRKEFFKGRFDMYSKADDVETGICRYFVLVRVVGNAGARVAKARGISW